MCCTVLRRCFCNEWSPIWCPTAHQRALRSCDLHPLLCASFKLDGGGRGSRDRTGGRHVRCTAADSQLPPTSVVHVKFVAAQKKIYHGSRIWEIPSLSNTRWVCRHDAVVSITRTLQAILSAIDELSYDAGERGNNARALQFQVNSCFMVTCAL